jgi:hypothetical protein
MVYQRHRIEYEFVSDEDTLSVTKKRISHMPFVDHTF